MCRQTIVVLAILIAFARSLFAGREANREETNSPDPDPLSILGFDGEAPLLAIYTNLTPQEERERFEQVHDALRAGREVSMPSSAYLHLIAMIQQDGTVIWSEDPVFGGLPYHHSHITEDEVMKLAAFIEERVDSLTLENLASYPLPFHGHFASIEALVNGRHLSMTIPHGLLQDLLTKDSVSTFVAAIDVDLAFKDVYTEALIHVPVGDFSSFPVIDGSSLGRVRLPLETPWLAEQPAGHVEAPSEVLDVAGTEALLTRLSTVHPVVSYFSEEEPPFGNFNRDQWDLLMKQSCRLHIGIWPDGTALWATDLQLGRGPYHVGHYTQKGMEQLATRLAELIEESPLPVEKRFTFYSCRGGTWFSVKRNMEQLGLGTTIWPPPLSVENFSVTTGVLLSDACDTSVRSKAKSRDPVDDQTREFWSRICVEIRNSVPPCEAEIRFHIGIGGEGVYLAE